MRARFSTLGDIKRLGLGGKLTLAFAAALLLSSCLSVAIAGYLLKQDFDERSDQGSKVVAHLIDASMSQYAEKITRAVDTLNADSELLRDVLSALGTPRQRRINYFRFLSKLDELGQKYEVDQINVYFQSSARQQFILYGVADSSLRHIFSFSPERPGEDPLEIERDEYGLISLKDQSYDNYPFRFPLTLAGEKEKFSLVTFQNQPYLDISYPLTNLIYGRDDDDTGFFKKGKVYGILRIFLKLPATFVEDLERRSSHTISFYREDGEFLQGKVKLEDKLDAAKSFSHMGVDQLEYINYPSTVMVKGLPFAKILVSFEQRLLKQKILQAIILIFTSTFLAALLLLYFLSQYLQNHLIQPIRRLTQFSQKFAEGDRSAWRSLDEVNQLIEHEEIGNLQQTFVAMGREIEETVTHLEERVKQETERLMFAQQTSISMGKMVAGIAHDMASPSALIKMEVQDAAPRLDQMQEKIAIIFADATDPDVLVVRDFFTDHLGTLGERIEHINIAVQRIIDIQSAIRNQARQDLKPESHNLSHLIHETCIIVQSKLRGLNVKQDCPDQTMLHCVRPQMGQVLTNLIGNAADALWENGYQRREGRTAIIVRCVPSEHKGMLLIEIEDDGPGVPDSIRTKIFEGNFTTKATGEGTGLGIVLSRSIIEQHGGTLKLATPRELSGACFQIEIPQEEQVQLVANAS